MITNEDMNHFAPTIIGFCGAKGHGKDTAAQVLIDKYDFVKVSFADRLRKTVATALGCNESYFLDPERKEEIDPRTGKSRRYWLQWIGTEGFRHLWDDVWIEAWKQDVRNANHDRILVTDLRFPNEFTAISGMKNAMTIRVENPRKPVNNDAHASELHYRDFDVDYVINNAFSIEALHNHVRLIAENNGITERKCRKVMDYGWQPDNAA